MSTKRSLQEDLNLPVLALGLATVMRALEGFAGAENTHPSRFYSGPGVWKVFHGLVGADGLVAQRKIAPCQALKVVLLRLFAVWSE